MKGSFEGLKGYAVGRMTKSRRGKIYIDDAGKAYQRLVADDDDPLPERLIGANYCATLLVVAPTRSTGALQNALQSALDALDVVSGVSALPGESGAIVRVLGTRAPAMREALAVCLASIRAELLMLAPPPRRLI